MKRTPWTSDELATVRQLYADTPTAAIAAQLGRHVNLVYRAAARQGLRKSADYMKGPHACRLRRGDHVGAAYRFKPGQVPVNKGVKHPRGWAPGRMSASQFRKGQKPHTWNPIGHERITDEGYLQRKITDTGETRHDYVNVHWLVWQAVHGPVPKGHALIFKNGNRSDIRLDNLELLTRAELMRRNSYHNRYPKEIGLLIQARGVLHRVINRRSREKQDSASA